ncbi:MAG: winged helix-turn-helix domain-containing protein, partial [Burkholderiales bacterium]|nr:winged helix-turn-helix domain-containing protein [Burkholderiales bacterium]
MPTLPDPTCWTLDPLTRRLACNGEPVSLGERAFDLLVALAAAPGRVVETDALLQQVWPGRVIEENNLHVHMAALRKLLGPDAIRTVRGRGYQLTRPVAAVPSGSATGPAPAGAIGRLPPLIGRDRELAQLLDLLAGHRCVSVVGPAGMGKTRLALAAAVALDEAADVVLVELADADAGSSVAEAASRALGISLPGLQAPLAELLDVLRTRRLLLVLDNCEHRMPEVSALISRLLQGTEGVRVLATSQLALRASGEQVMRLGPLALPAPGASPVQVRRAGAVALLGARLAVQSPGVALEDLDAARLEDVVDICRGLDGLPLAIELAAARVPLLGLAGVRQRLGQQMQLLGGGSRGAGARHQTLRTALAWSHALLSEDERRALRRLGVLAGSFSLTLARQVLADRPDDDWPVLDLLQGLLDKSLLVPLPVDHDAPPRLRLLESTRAFAQEQLKDSGDGPAAFDRLTEAMLGLFERGDGPLAYDASAAETLARGRELDNLRATLDGLAVQPALALRHIELVVASAWIWSRLGLRAEGVRRCRQALDRVDTSTPPRLEARLQLAWASAVHRRGAPGDAAAAARARDLYEGLGDRLGRFRALSVLAAIHALDGREAEGMAALEELADTFDPGWGAVQWAAYHYQMGYSLAQLDHDAQVLALRDRGQAHLRHFGDDAAHATALVGLAQLAWVTGDLAEALATAERAVATARRARSDGRLGIALGDLATYLVDAGRVNEALPLAREAVGLRALDGSLGLLLDQLAMLAAARGRHEEAALALGRAIGLLPSDVARVPERGRERVLGNEDAAVGTEQGPGFGPHDDRGPVMVVGVDVRQLSARAGPAPVRPV